VIPIDFSKVFLPCRICEKNIYSMAKSCPHCGAAGPLNFHLPEDLVSCFVCKGSGWVKVFELIPYNSYMPVPKPENAAQNEDNDIEKCYMCNGEGKLTKERVNIEFGCKGGKHPYEF